MAEAVRALGYSPQELVDNNMEILLPFQIIRLWKKAKEYSNLSEDNKNTFLYEFEEMCYNIVKVMDKLKQKSQITNDEYQQMFLIIHDLYDYIYGTIDDISEKGADSMIKERFISTYDKALTEGSYERALKIAENMIKANMSAIEIEKLTELKLADIKPLAEKLKVSLVI